MDTSWCPLVAKPNRLHLGRHQRTPRMNHTSRKITVRFCSKKIVVCFVKETKCAAQFFGPARNRKDALIVSASSLFCHCDNGLGLDVGSLNARTHMAGAILVDCIYQRTNIALVESAVSMRRTLDATQRILFQSDNNRLWTALHDLCFTCSSIIFKGRPKLQYFLHILKGKYQVVHRQTVHKVSCESKAHF